MYYSDDPARDWEHYSQDCDRERKREVLEEIRELERKLEDDDAYIEWIKEYAEDNDEVYKIYEKYINRKIEELEEELETL